MLDIIFNNKVYFDSIKNLSRKEFDKKMVEENRYCDDVLIQLSAIDKSIKSLANIILEEHIHTCVVNDVQNGKLETLDEIIDLFKRFQ